MDNDNTNKEESQLPYLIKITKFVYKQYKEDIKNNADSDYILCRKKITRNWILAECVNSTKEFEWRRYGCLYLCRDRYDDRIINLFNAKGRKLPFNINEEDKAILDNIYGLNDKNKDINTYNIELNNENDTHKIINNETFVEKLIECTARFSQALKNLRG